MRYPRRIRITELAEATGVAPATVKYYVREGLLPRARA
ncbi:MerR family DNA-binding transcriptional regulator [Clavibacter sepedonicus]|nr:MerR family DNA-binding transcriptional regulator [Clavibacter sepedonicus]